MTSQAGTSIAKWSGACRGGVARGDRPRREAEGSETQPQPESTRLRPQPYEAELASPQTEVDSPQTRIVKRDVQAEPVPVEGRHHLQIGDGELHLERRWRLSSLLRWALSSTLDRYRIA